MATTVPAASGATSLTDDIRQAREQVQAGDKTETTSAVEATPPAEGETTLPTTKAELEAVLENPTAEELAAIDADPKLSKIYKSMQRGLTAKTTKMSEQTKQIEDERAAIEQERTEFSSARTLYDAIRDNPKGVIKAIAERNGMSIKDAEAVVDEIDPELTEMFGDDATTVKPLFDKAVEKRAKAVVDAALGPIVKHLNDKAVEGMKQDIASDMRSFGAELKEQKLEMSPEIEKEMVKFSKQLDQAEGVSTRDYLRMLYTLSTANKPKAQVTKEVLERMRRATEEREPTSIPTGGVTPGTAALDPKLSFRDSVRVAREEVRAGR